MHIPVLLRLLLGIVSIHRKWLTVGVNSVFGGVQSKSAKPMHGKGHKRFWFLLKDFIGQKIFVIIVLSLS
jgi:hypothetical protein